MIQGIPMQFPPNSFEDKNPHGMEGVINIPGRSNGSLFAWICL